MTRAAACLILAASILVFESVGSEALPSESTIAHGTARSPAARTAQSSYPLPTPPEPTPILPEPTPILPGPTPILPLQVMSPFPIVRVLGQTTPTGARIRVLSVRAPTSATIVVRCRTRGCSRRSLRRGGGIRRPVRFKRFERRLRAGTILEVFVGRTNVIGKYTRFRIRRGRPPSRRDLCLLPAAKKGSPCPEG